MTLQEQRKRAGLTQSDLALLLGVDRVTIWRWEQGFTTPTGVMKKRLALALRTLDQADGGVDAQAV